MNRWKSIVLNHWRAKLASLVAAALVWSALRYAIPPPSGGPASPLLPTPTQGP